jgi:hypothetical protein
MGRPSLKTPELCDAICKAVSQGTTLVDACRDNGISKDAWNDWVNADEELKRRFACARADGHDAIAYRARETARGAGDSSGDVQRDKLIIETDLKLLAKWDRRYADKIMQEHSGNMSMTLAKDEANL